MTDLTEKELDVLEKHAIAWDVDKVDARKLIAMACQYIELKAENEAQLFKLKTKVNRMLRGPETLKDWLPILLPIVLVNLGLIALQQWEIMQLYFLLWFFSLGVCSLIWRTWRQR